VIGLFLDPMGSLAPMRGGACESCGAEPTANGRECPDCFRERLGSVSVGFAPTRSLGAGQMDRTKTRAWENRLEDYRKVRVEGSQPATTRRSDIEATKRESDRTGAAVRADRAALEAAGRL
jgi:hypothetical protein